MGLISSEYGCANDASPVSIMGYPKWGAGIHLEFIFIKILADTSALTRWGFRFVKRITVLFTIGSSLPASPLSRPAGSRQVAGPAMED
jgi:hypothetical protein